MKKIILFSLLIFIAANLFAAPGELRYFTPKGEFIIPASDIPRPGHPKTNYIIFKPNKLTLASHAAGETPASIACVYGLTTPMPGCPIQGTTALPISPTGLIAIVDPGEDPYAESELNTFSAYFGLPACTKASNCFQEIKVGTPIYNPDISTEIALDIEWVHAMAPQANIALYESDNALDATLDAGQALSDTNGGGIVSNSWGSPEDSAIEDLEQQIDAGLSSLPNVTYFFAAGDFGAPPPYPATSPYVVAAGGTTILRNNQGDFIGENAWSFDPITLHGGGGGPSLYEPRPAYQNLVQKIVGTQRGTPDLSADANPETGVRIYSIPQGGWIIIGGTSVSTPLLAGMFFTSGAPFTNAQAFLSRVYGNYPKSGNHNWRDITVGNNHPYNCLKGYDLVTGLGSPIGYNGFRG